MSLLLSFNILAVLSALLFFTGYDLGDKLMEQLSNYFSSELALNFSWYIIGLLIPSMIISYFLVFYKEKYNYILERYEFKNGKYLLIYFCLTIIAVFGFSLLNKLGNVPDMMGW